MCHIFLKYLSISIMRVVSLQLEQKEGTRMRIVRYLASGQPAWGLVDDKETIWDLIGSPFGGSVRGAAVGDLDSLALLPPVVPTKIVCIGRNYAAHAAELGNEVPPEPLIFLKPPSAIIGPDRPIRLPALSQRVEHEAELVLVIGRQCRDLSEENALDVLLGFTCGNDVTARDLQRKDGQWTRGKGFDTFCPIGPWIVTVDEWEPAGQRILCRVNGEIRQDGNTSDLIFSLPRLLRDISAVMTLEPGDIIMTGTPSGVGPLAAGDRCEVEIEGLGTLLNGVEE
jgi:2-keto-4-pentenoate hydratase/2-oxohepta-3-ene-1,7-dioic acid hydratase in catechol pathway